MCVTNSAPLIPSLLSPPAAACAFRKFIIPHLIITLLSFQTQFMTEQFLQQNHHMGDEWNDYISCNIIHQQASSLYKTSEIHKLGIKWLASGLPIK